MPIHAVVTQMSHGVDDAVRILIGHTEPSRASALIPVPVPLCTPGRKVNRQPVRRKANGLKGEI